MTSEETLNYHGDYHDSECPMSSNWNALAALAEKARNYLTAARC